jgi:hypothetical protein
MGLVRIPGWISVRMVVQRTAKFFWGAGGARARVRQESIQGVRVQPAVSSSSLAGSKNGSGGGKMYY